MLLTYQNAPKSKEWRSFNPVVLPVLLNEVFDLIQRVKQSLCYLSHEFKFHGDRKEISEILADWKKCACPKMPLIVCSKEQMAVLLKSEITTVNSISKFTLEVAILIHTNLRYLYSVLLKIFFSQT